MPGDDPRDLRVRSDNRAETLGIHKAVGVHRRDPGAERRMMHREDRGPAGVGAQFRVEPRESLVIQPSAAASRLRGIQADNAQRPRVDRKACMTLKGP